MVKMQTHIFICTQVTATRGMHGSSGPRAAWHSGLDRDEPTISPITTGRAQCWTGRAGLEASACPKQSMC